jgi:hypothetical protein
VLSRLEVPYRGLLQVLEFRLDGLSTLLLQFIDVIKMARARLKRFLLRTKSYDVLIAMKQAMYVFKFDQSIIIHNFPYLLQVFVYLLIFIFPQLSRLFIFTNGLSLKGQNIQSQLCVSLDHEIDNFWLCALV